MIFYGQLTSKQECAIVNMILDSTFTKMSVFFRLM